MTTHKHSLADVIACSWWPNEGPVYLRHTPFIEPDLVVTTRHGRADYKAKAKATSYMPRVLAALVDGCSTTAEVVERTGIPSGKVSNALCDLVKRGRVATTKKKHCVQTWLLLEDEGEAAAAE